MANEPKQEGGKSMKDIAATLVSNSPSSAPKGVEDDPKILAAVTGTEEEFEESTPEEDEEDQSPDGGEEEDQEELEANEEAGDEEDPEDDEKDSGETDYLDINDEDLITVMVDGEEQEVSIGDLKRAHSGEGAIEKRLQEATEERKAATAERTQALEKLAAQERDLVSAFDGLDDSFFKAVIPPPDEKMRNTDATRYLQHKEAYDNDQKRISDAKALIESKRREIAEQRQERLKEFGQQAAQIIAQEIPELVKPETSKETFKKLSDTAASYGYSQAEIDNALDPRMFMLVRDAMKYREITSKTKERNPMDLTQQKAKKVRRLRSGNTQAKTRARRADQTRKDAVARAKQTGKPSDVAATLLVPKG